MASLMASILGGGRPQPFQQPQSPLDVLKQPVNTRRTAMAKAALESIGKPANLLEGLAGGLRAVGANRLLDKQDQQMQDRRSAMAQLLGGEDGKGVTTDEIERQAVLAGDDSLMELAKMRRKAEGDGSDFGLNMIWGTDADGNTVAFQANKGGGVRPVQFPKGVKPTPGMSFQDMGTYVLPVNNKTGVPGAPMTKDVAGAEQEKAEGKGRGEASVALPQIEDAGNLMLRTIDDLSSDPYLPSMLGPVNARLPNISGDAARVQSKMDQIQGQTFLQAYDTLRGGGQITEVEGAKAEKAKARLAAAQNEQDYRAALKDLRDVVVNAMGTAKRKAGASADAGGAPTAPPAGGNKSGLKSKYGLE